jgi:transposase-like protein
MEDDQINPKRRPRPMRKVPPSQMVREQIEQTLSGGVDTQTNLLSALAQLGLSYLVQQSLEQEQEDFLGRSRYERRSGDEAVGGYRNGYEQATLRTAEGVVGVRIPQVRDTATPYRSLG